MPDILLRFLSVIIASTIILSACNGGDDGDKTTVTRLDVNELSNDTLAVGKMDYTPSSNTITISESDLENLSISDGGTLISVFSDSPLFNSIKENDILMAGISSCFPEGLLKKVKSIERYKEQIDLKITDTPLTNAFRYLQTNFYKHLDFTTATLQSLDKDVQIQYSGTAALLDLNFVIYDRDMEPGTTDDQIKITGTVIFDLGFSFNMALDLWSLSRIEFKPYIYEETQITIDSDVGYDVKVTKEIARFSFPSFSVGPVIFTPEFILNIDANGDISAQSKASVGCNYSQQFSFFHDGDKPLYDDQLDRQILFAWDEPSITSDTNLKTTLTNKLDIGIYGSSSANIESKENFTIAGFATPAYNRLCIECDSEFNTSAQINLGVFKKDDEEASPSQIFTGKQHLFDTCNDIFHHYPVADAGQDQEVKELASVVLNGAKSHDPDDGISTFEWRQTAGTEVQLSTPHLAVTKFSAPDVPLKGDILKFDLTITDNGGRTDTDSVEIHILDDDGSPKIPGQISGQIKHYGNDGQILPLGGVEISIIEDKNVEASATSDPSGYFSIDIRPGTWDIELKKEGFITNTYTNKKVQENSEVNLNTIYMLDDSNSTENEISGTCVDSISGSKIRGLKIILYSQKTGSPVESTTTDLSGKFTFSDLDPGVYLLKSSEGYYMASEFTMSTGSTRVVAINPIINSHDEIRIVLSWGPSSSNLDAHVYGPSSTGDMFHLFYPYLNDPYSERPYIQLDRDAIAPDGIETILIRKRFKGTYSFMVHDFSNQLSLNSFELSLSNAIVKVYKGFKEMASFSVPKDTEGNFWEVFELDGETGEITPSNKMSHKDVPAIDEMFGGKYSL
ncbi:MAG: carboxypeptidase regulatory-like domain-containing protein [Desulfobacteraceae bacterium]|nr:carboxypeptidase regulatory-like domain-containing protein [Desulfobacteraceae bacterium]